MPAEEGFIIVGFPRNLNQLLFMEGNFLNYDLLVLLNQPEPLLYEKSKLRQICQKCCKSFCNSFFNYENYSLPNISPDINSTCPICSSSLTRRKSDEQRSFKKRFFQFKVYREDLLKYYSNKERFLEFPLLQGVNDLNRLIHEIESRRKHHSISSS
jgi:adenylate kinase family enzyme